MPSRRRLSRCICVLLVSLCWCRIASAQEAVTLQGAPQITARGAQKIYPVMVSEDSAFEAIFKGGMWLPNPAGGRIYAKYDHHILHNNGDLTWIGKVATARGQQSAVITFGADAVFGSIPQMQGYPLRLITEHGRRFLVQTDAKALQQAPQAQRLNAHPDFSLPSPHAANLVSTANATPAATTGQPATVDLMVAYTPGFVQEYGSRSAALTRINYIVAVANQAYADSQVHAQVRLVHAAEVNYPDNTDDAGALSDLSGIDVRNGKAAKVSASLAKIQKLRKLYGADLVSLVRKYDDASNGSCGYAWIIGADHQSIDPATDDAYGYSVVGDGGDGGYYCADQGLAHELGHNMGFVHDAAHAAVDSKGNPVSGAYAYSSGFAAGSGASSVATIMAQPVDGQTPVSAFSTPTTCAGQTCALSAQSNGARSLNQTMPMIAQFVATQVSGSGVRLAHNDINGDGKSDLIYQNASMRQFSYWLMNGNSVVSKIAIGGVGAGYWVVATGDFNGDGKLDIVWTSAANDLYMWTGNGSGGFTSVRFGDYPSGWQVVGAGDVDGDGKSDVLFYSSSLHLLSYRIMSGTTQVRAALVGPAGVGYWVAAIGDFNGDGKLDIVWTSAANDLYMWTGNGSGFTSVRFGDYPSGWQVVGAGDVDGDAKSDVVFYSPSLHLLSYRIMSGTTQLRAALVGPVGAGYGVATMGDFNGDGKLDIVWTSTAKDLYMWTGDGTGFVSKYFGSY